MPMGPRACSSEICTPKRAKASTKTLVGAKEPKSTSVPAQSKTSASRRTGSVASVMAFIPVESRSGRRRAAPRLGARHQRAAGQVK
ncbi:Uncharacterised protein [Bordetella pertussis]|nr:Uncharacterised protein [Bordetella pertussis]